MDSKGISRSLVEAFSQFTIIDAHEHLGPEETHLRSEASVFSLFGHYTRTDLQGAGMTEEWARVKLDDASIPVEERWKVFKPFYQHIKNGSYAEAAQITARDIYGVDRIDDDTYLELSRRMRENNTKGIYDRILKEKCRIECCLSQNRELHANDGFLLPLTWFRNYWFRDGRSAIESAEGETGRKIGTLEKYLEYAEERVTGMVSAGFIGLKTRCMPLDDPGHDASADMYHRLYETGDLATEDAAGLSNHVSHFLMDLAGRLDIPVAVHCGIFWNNWTDFYENHPQHIVPCLIRHQATRFDLYHAAVPWVSDMAYIGKALPNAHLNLCWTHMISRRLAVRALDEWLDSCPTNKIIAFGGDNLGTQVEKTWGELVMARENIANVLAKRIDVGRMSESDAIHLAKAFFYDNPKRLYKL